jgi:nucleoside 2-deoxyribosyltransferase
MVKRGSSRARDVTRRVLAEAMKDLQEISSSDLLIRDVHTISHTGGADTEYGFAMARHQHCMVWLVGPKRNVFHMLADKHFKTWNECLKELKKYK